MTTRRTKHATLALALLATAATAGIARAQVPNPLEAPVPTVGAMPAPTSSPIPSVQASPTDVVIGFGHDVAVSAALHDVVPPGTNVRFAPGASPRARVDWKGGSAWRETVSAIAASAGMTAKIDADGVMLSKPGATVRAEAAPAAHPATRTKPAVHPRTYAHSGNTVTAERRNPRYDSPTVEEMSAADAAAYTPAPVGSEMAALPGPYDSTAPATGKPYMPTYAIPRTARRSGPPAGQLAGTDGDVPPYAAASAGISGFVPGEEAARGTWHITTGSDLFTTLQAWCKQAGNGWTVYSGTPLTYTMYATMTFSGGISDATKELINAIHAPIRPYAEIHGRTILLTDAEHISISLGGK